MLAKFEMSDTKKIGSFLMVLGIFFFFLGFVLLLDRKLLAMGNLLFLIGFCTLSGIGATLRFFGFAGSWRERWTKRWRGLLTFQGGIVLVLFGYSKLGIFLQMFGFLNLYGPLFPIALAFLRKVPIIGPCLNLPGVSIVADKIAGKSIDSMV